MKIELSDKTLLAYLEGEVTQSQAAAIEAALADAPADRRRLERLREMLGHLAGAPDELDQIDLVPAVRGAIAAMPAPAARRRQTWPFLAMAAVMLLAAGSLVANRFAGSAGSAGGAGGQGGDQTAGGAATGGAAPADTEFRAKAAGPDTPGAANDRWVNVTAYRVAADAPAGAEPEPLGARMRTGDGLLFSFDNLGPKPFGYLMIFAVDRAGEVYWFYPAYEQAGADPASLDIRGDIRGDVRGQGRGSTPAEGQRAVELPDLIRHAFPAGPLAIYGVFTHTPLRVSRVEESIAALVRAGAWNASQPPRLALPDAGQEVAAVKVEP